MLSIELNQPLQKSLFSPITYSQQIHHLASNTIARKKGLYRKSAEEVRPFDISEICCWTCEKPLVNGMYMITRKSGDNGNIAIIGESISSDRMEEDEPLRVSIANQGEEGDQLLLCGDCISGLEMMLDSNLPILFPDSGTPIEVAKERRNKDNYIWPNDVNVGDGYTPSECFTYVRKSVFVIQPKVYVDEKLETIEYETTVQYGIFVEPNPDLPEYLFRRALNTIRLFRLNGKYYQYGQEEHMIFYPDRESSLEDDLRLSGRNKAYDRARMASHQLKSVKDMYGEAEIVEMLNSQHKILVELNGYRSVWSTVFEEGDDPDDSNGILGPVAPLVPVSPIVDKPKSADNPIKKDAWNLNNPNEDLPVYKKKRDIKADRKEEAENKVKDVRARLLSNGRRIAMSPGVNKVVPAPEDYAWVDEFWEWYKRTYGIETQKRRFIDALSPYAHEPNDFPMPVMIN